MTRHDYSHNATLPHPRTPPSKAGRTLWTAPNTSDDYSHNATLPHPRTPPLKRDIHYGRPPIHLNDHRN
jgi:hypothetical protein